MKKRVLAALLCACMAATLCVGCGGDETPNTESQKTEESQGSEESSQPESQDTQDTQDTQGAENQGGTTTGPSYSKVEPVAHITFDGEDEGYSALVQVKDDAGAITGLAAAEGVTFEYVDGAVGKCLYINGDFGLDLGLEATNTDTYAVSFWVNADRLATFGPTLQMGYNVGGNDTLVDVTWMNVTQSEWGVDSAKIFPIVWSRDVASNAEDGTVCWPWMYAFDNEIHGKREWCMVTIVCSGEEQTGANGQKTVGAQFYVNGELKYDSNDNYTNGTYFEYTWDATLAPSIMQPGDAEFESYFGINFWDTVFKGYVDDLYIFNAPIGAEQVAELYALGNPAVNPNAE